MSEVADHMTFPVSTLKNLNPDSTSCCCTLYTVENGRVGVFQRYRYRV
jgi:hypothetical protein